MSKLRIDLQEGFKNDNVVIKLGGRTVFRNKAVTTKLLLGYAHNVILQVPEGPAHLTISLPRRSIDESVDLDMTADVYLGVSLASGRLEVVPSKAPFSYA